MTENRGCGLGARGRGLPAGDWGDRRSSQTIGRDARLELAFERRGGRTVLAHSYVEPPFRVGRCLAIDDAAYVILACTGPGIFPGDTLRQMVHVGEGARAVLTSQASLQVHPGAAALAATIHQSYGVERGGELHCVWDALIPFAGARLAQRADIRLAASSRLLWSDALMAGRVARGEAWQFDDLSHELRVRVDGRLQYAERYRIAPRESMPTRPWIAGGAHYFSTVLAHGEAACGEHAETLHRELAGFEQLTAASDLVCSRLIVARLASAHGASFAVARAACHRALLENVLESPALAGRKSVG